MSEDRALLMTFGHGTLSQAAIVDVLHGAGVEQVVDVRRFPGSRRHPHVARDEFERWLPAAGVAYRWEPRLGGRRRSDPAEAAVDPWWQVEAFRAYAAHARTVDFGHAIDELLAGAAASRTAVMCSESLWWRCHRRLISDVCVLLHDVPVQHLGHDGRLTAHLPAAGARVTARGLVYDRSRDDDRPTATREPSPNR
ncbi:MAG: DUF488 domain-containing protein [Cellulomonas sp.]|uniref:DUF488 domain-containing protein n=2 Tax=Cellulomonas TaxID=1707 RepID=UPI001E50C37D|nr:MULTISPECIES: DUF488 domain-containing protein [Cellulomonas]MCR6647473.1 DUF488 domain-containing protein [Cellulomonas sp.]